MSSFNEEFLEKIFRDNSEWFENIDIEKHEIGEGFDVYLTLSGICVHFSCSEDTFLDEINKMIDGLKTEPKFSDSEDASFGQKHALECFENIKKSMPNNKYKCPERNAVKENKKIVSVSENKNIKNPKK